MKGIAITCLALPCLAAAGIGPTGTLYMTADSGSFLVSLTGTTQVYAPTAVGGEGPIAVYDTIHTTGQFTGGLGASYDLGGGFAGDLYANGVPGASFDATTDGVHNYVINQAGDVYATDGSYQQATWLFWAGPDPSGIAYDPSHQSLWINVAGILTEFDTSGAAQSAFALHDSLFCAVAYDRSDGTLWTGASFGGGTVFSQYATDGTLLQSYVPDNTLAISGMEFSEAVPEPATFLVFSLCALPVIVRRRSRASR